MNSRSHSFVLLLAGVGCLGANDSPLTPEQQNILAGIKQRDVAAIGKAGQLPKPLVHEALFEVISRTTVTRDSNKAAQELLQKMEGFPEWVGAKFRNIPHYHENWKDRGEMLHIVGRFRQRWAVDLLAELIIKDEPLTTGLNPQMYKLYEADGIVPGERNSRLAARVMVKMQLSNFPVTTWGHTLHADSQKAIRQWLIDNKDQPDIYFLNPEELKKDPTWNKPDPQFAKLGRVTAWEIKPANQIPPPKPSLPAPPPPEKGSGGGWFWVVGGAALLVLVAVYWLRFRDASTDHIGGI